MKKDTACENCPFKRMGFSECPNYIETVWHEQGSQQPTIVKDCAPKRSLLMIQELYNRTFGLQQQVSQGEKEIGEMRAAVSRLFEAIRYMEENRLTESEAKNKFLRHMQSMKYCEGESFKRIDMGI